MESELNGKTCRYIPKTGILNNAGSSRPGRGASRRRRWRPPPAARWPTATEVISKPQIVQPEKSAQRGIKTYVTKQGDTINSIAKKFNVTAQTVRWANNTTSDAVEAGKTLISM